MFYFCLFVCIDLYENDHVRGVWDEIFLRHIRLQDPSISFFFFSTTLLRLCTRCRYSEPRRAGLFGCAHVYTRDIL